MNNDSMRELTDAMMEEARAGEKMRFLIELINPASEKYYAGLDSGMTDEYFDNLMNQLKSLEVKYPSMVVHDSPTQRVGSKATGYFKNEHVHPMLSLDNVFPEEGALTKQLKKWMNGIKRQIPDTPILYCVEPKYDGLAVELVYKDSVLVRATTRGDGIKGDDVTENVKQILSVPKILKNNQRGEVVVYGEVLMSNPVFNRLLHAGVVSGNPRNSAAGSLRLLNPDESRERQLSFIPYGLKSEVKEYNQTDSLNQLKAMGFNLDFDDYVFAGEIDIKSIEELYQKLMATRTTSDKQFNVDGVVVKVNATRLQERLGSTAQYPKHAIAFKFYAQTGTSYVVSVSNQVGRTGVITPVAEIQPIELNGVQISYVNLHNYNLIKEQDIRIGDMVTVGRSGDVIPHIDSVVKTARVKGQTRKITEPKFCPCCESELIQLPGQQKLYCKHAYFTSLKGNYDFEGRCDASILEHAKYFVSKDCMNIVGMGPEIVEKLYRAEVFFHPVEIFNLNYSILAGVLYENYDLTNQTLDKLYQNIEKARDTTLDKVILSLNIPGIGPQRAKLIAQVASKRKGNGLEKLNLSIKELTEIPKLGNDIIKVYRDHIANFLSGNPMNAKRYENILHIRVIPVTPPVKTKPAVEPKTLAITGVFEEMGRNEIKGLIEASGWTLTTQVNKSTDYLLVGSSPGSKLVKAQELNVPLINLDQLLILLK